jgi:hypothetical protein
MIYKVIFPDKNAIEEMMNDHNNGFSFSIIENIGNSPWGYLQTSDEDCLLFLSIKYRFRIVKIDN